MAVSKKDRKRAIRRKERVRNKVRKNVAIPRVSVFRSLNHMYAQVIDDNAGKTIASCSSLELKNTKGDKKAVAQAVGLELAKRAKEKGIERASLDRGPYLYHGRIAALTQGLRDGGIQI